MSKDYADLLAMLGFLVDWRMSDMATIVEHQPEGPYQTDIDAVPIGGGFARNGEAYLKCGDRAPGEIGPNTIPCLWLKRNAAYPIPILCNPADTAYPVNLKIIVLRIGTEGE